MQSMLKYALLMSIVYVSSSNVSHASPVEAKIIGSGLFIVNGLPVTSDIEADFFYNTSNGTTTNTTSINPPPVGTVANSEFNGVPGDAKAVLKLPFYGDVNFGSEDSFTVDYTHDITLGFSAASFDIIGAAGTLAGSFVGPTPTSVPAMVNSPFSMVNPSSFGAGNYSINMSPDAPLTGFINDIDSIEVINLSAVPLPSSAPMFGTAVVALGAVGYGLKRRKVAAAA